MIIIFGSLGKCRAVVSKRASFWVGFPEHFLNLDLAGMYYFTSSLWALGNRMAFISLQREGHSKTTRTFKAASNPEPSALVDFCPMSIHSWNTNASISPV